MVYDTIIKIYTNVHCFLILECLFISVIHKKIKTDTSNGGKDDSRILGSSRTVL